MIYTSKSSKDCKVSNLTEAQLDNLIKKSESLLLVCLGEFLNKEQIKQFKEGNTTLISLGICTGMLNKTNEELQSKINSNLCVLDTDTLNKFKDDIRRDF